MQRQDSHANSTSAIAPVPNAETAVTRRIDLDPADWFLATWRDLKPLPRPAPAPFDPDEARLRLGNVKGESYDPAWNWSAVPVPAMMTRPEAHFWFRAMTANTRTERAPQLGARVRDQTFDGGLTLAEVEAALWGDRPPDLEKKRPPTPARYGVPQSAVLPFVPGKIFVPLATLLGTEQAVAVLLRLARCQRLINPYAAGTHARQYAELVRTFARCVVPYLETGERQRLRQLLAPEVEPAKWRNSAYSPAPLAFQLAARLGMHQELLAVVSRWRDNLTDHAQTGALADLAFGLGDPDLVIHHVRRLRRRLTTPDHLRAWLAHTECAALDEVRDAILLLRQPGALRGRRIEDFMEVFCLVKAPEAAPLLLELKQAGVAPALARRWLDEQVGNAVAGLVPFAAGRGKFADAAAECLRDARREGHAAVTEGRLRLQPPDAAARVRRLVLGPKEDEYPAHDRQSTPPWLDKAVMSLDATGLPGWLRPSRLPPVVLHGRRLNDAQVRALLAALRERPASPPRVVHLLKENAGPDSLDAFDAFAWRLFELWQEVGAPDEDAWVWTALGHFGGDASVLKLARLVRAWVEKPPTHARALDGLDCLKAIGTEAALMHLCDFAHTARAQKVQEKARILIQAAAREQRLGARFLEDRAVPDFGLDERGGLTLDFGSRKFRVVLGPGFRPAIKDEEGALRNDLPRPSRRDDRAKAARAARTWQHFRPQVREVFRLQTARLERAMLESRHWTVRAFEERVARHPLLRHLAGLLLWAACGKDARTAVPFRLAEDGAFVDERDEPVSLKGFATVSLPHPVLLTAEQRAVWGEVFSDYEILSPFPQLARPVHTPDDCGEAREVPCFRGVRVVELAVRKVLRDKGWVTQYGAGLTGEARHFPAADTTALIKLSGWSVRTIEGATFLRGPIKGPNRLSPKDALLLKEVDPVVYSETVMAAALLASKNHWLQGNGRGG